MLLSPDHPAPPADYDDPLAVQMYAEMHLASFRTDLTAGVTAGAADGVPGFADAVPRSVGGVTDSADAATVVSRAANVLHHIEDLTGPYYRHMATIILENLRHPAGLVADIGCGMARMAFELELGAWPGRYLGLDLSYRLLIEAQRAFTGETGYIQLTDPGAGGLHTRLVPIQPPKLPPDRYTLVLGDSAHLPLPDQSCAAVVALNLVDRVADPISVTHELWRCVAPGGLLVLSDPFQWRDRPPEQRIYSFDPLTCDLDDAAEVHLPPDLPHVPFTLRDRASREISIHDNATALYRRTR